MTQECPFCGRRTLAPMTGQPHGRYAVCQLCRDKVEAGEEDQLQTELLAEWRKLRESELAIVRASPETPHLSSSRRAAEP